MCAGETATRVTIGSGPASCTGFSQARSAVMGTSSSASLSKANRTESLCLNVMALFPHLHCLRGVVCGDAGDASQDRIRASRLHGLVTGEEPGDGDQP